MSVNNRKVFINYGGKRKKDKKGNASYFHSRITQTLSLNIDLINKI
jgi:hypothetical protein